MSNATPIVIWFKRDLRVNDHATLAWASQQDRPVVPLYVVEPDYWQLPDTSARQFEFLRESLGSLNMQLAALGAPLIVRCGSVKDVLAELNQQFGQFELISHEETGNLWTFQRDLSVADWARSQGIRWREVPQSGVVRRLQGRDGWAKSRNIYVAKPQRDAPVALRATCLDSLSLIHI